MVENLVFNTEAYTHAEYIHTYHIAIFIDIKHTLNDIYHQVCIHDIHPIG